MASEAQARITINKLLEEAGWRFLPDAQGKRENIICEHRVSGRTFAPNHDLGKDFERAPDGFVDYVLLDNDGHAVAVVEAKRESIDPLSAKEQARGYAEKLGVSHIFLSNGLVHYYWNLRQGNPVTMSRFLPLEELGKAAEWRPDPARLAAVPVDENYISVSQDAAWLTYSTADRAAVMVNKKIRLLRDYQVAAARALQKAAAKGRNRFLFEMATGTGKTLLSAAIAKLYLRTENATETNLSFARCFLDHAKRDPISGEVGKTICFAVSRKHATKLVTLLNEEATRRWPKAYAAGSTFAAQVTSDQPGAQQMTIDFSNNNLNGKSKWQAEALRDYDTSRTRVCVTVGMMTTGYDCEDVLNVVLARPIFSPTDFIQIKGRGTRLYTFKHRDGATERCANKDGYALFDFFANCEYFEEEFDYDQKLSVPKGEDDEGAGGGGGGGGSRPEAFANTSPDPMTSVIRDEIGLFGTRIDREMYRERFAHQAIAAAASDAILREAFEAEDWPAVEERVRRLLFDKQEEFWNLPKLQELYKTDRTPSLREIMAHVFGLIPSISTRAQLADEAFERFITTQETNAVHRVPWEHGRPAGVLGSKHRDG